MKDNVLTPFTNRDLPRLKENQSSLSTIESLNPVYKPGPFTTVPLFSPLKTTGYNSVSGDQTNSHEVTPKSTLLFAIFLNDFNARRHIL
ncbi:hypothetical protein [Desulforhopalus vacuolatus]|uniref:hypothetical protein n=1 Tax=Desulforhopalus vacuolatus TaxID=40414 RepID=UPI003F6CCD70